MASRGSRGFTLVELMVVVAIVGVLAVVGITLLRKYVFSSKTVEAVAVIQAIRGAEERYRAENQVYYGPSVDDTWYPNVTPGKTTRAWRHNGHTHFDNWERLNVLYTHPVQFGYLVNAGLPTEAYPALQTADKATGWPDPATEPWYVIQARADADADGTSAFFLASSYNNEIYSEAEGE